MSGCRESVARSQDDFIRRISVGIALVFGLGACDAPEDDAAPVGALVARLDEGAAGSGQLEPGMHQHPVGPTPALMEDDAGMDDMSDAGVEPMDLATEHCTMAMPADPRDADLDPAPVVFWISLFSRDVLLPQPIIDWMTELGLPPAHDAWHTTRRWDDICGNSFAAAEDCDFAQQLLADQLWRAEFQQGGPGSGSAFLHMHRHMIQMLKAAFPTHAGVFAGWSHVPRSRDDAENPTPWRTISWTEDNLDGFDILEHIEDHLDLFPSEDELGVYIESNFRWTPEDPVAPLNEPGAGTHGAMHNQWAVNRSPANLGRTDTALPNYTFWKLHGFIDAVWTRYRIAMGSSDSDPEYQAIALAQCKLMYYLVPEHRAGAPHPLMKASALRADGLRGAARVREARRFE